MAEIKIAIFDKDGTLLDSSPTTLETHIQTLSDIATREETTILINNTLGYNADTQYAMMLLAKRNNVPIQEILDNESMHREEIDNLISEDRLIPQLLSRFWETVRRIPVYPFPDTLPAIRRLKESGFRLGISTGYRTDITIAQITSSDLLDFFDRDLIFGYDPPLVKGDPHIEELMRRVRINREQLKEVYIIDDGVKVMETAKKYGMVACGIDRTGIEKQLRDAGATEVFHDLIECSNYILQRSK